MNFWITFLWVPSIHHSKGRRSLRFFSQASLSFITVLGVYILIKLATSPFYHVWTPCVYPSKSHRLFKVITYFSEKQWMPAITSTSWWIKLRVFPNTSKQSQKLKVHEEDINNFGKVPSIDYHTFVPQWCMANLGVSVSPREETYCLCRNVWRKLTEPSKVVCTISKDQSY